MAIKSMDLKLTGRALEKAEGVADRRARGDNTYQIDAIFTDWLWHDYCLLKAQNVALKADVQALTAAAAPPPDDVDKIEILFSAKGQETAYLVNGQPAGWEDLDLWVQYGVTELTDAFRNEGRATLEINRKPSDAE